MDAEDTAPARHHGGALARLVAEDLDPLSVAELEARIAALEGEIARCRTRIAAASAQRLSAEALFGRK